MPPPPDPSAVVCQVLTFSTKLAEALTDAEPFGGLAGLQMKPATRARVVAELRMLRDEIDESLARLDHRPHSINQNHVVR